jgi:hypothetical protein
LQSRLNTSSGTGLWAVTALGKDGGIERIGIKAEEPPAH